MKKTKIVYSATLRDKIFRFAHRLLGSREDAQDVVQDVFLKLWKQDKWTEENNIHALSFKIAKNICLNRLKHQKVISSSETEIRNEIDYPNLNYEGQELVEITEKFIDKLPEKQKMAIHLRDVEGFELEEIAQILGIDASAVRMNLSRARKTVKEQIIKIINHGL